MGSRSVFGERPCDEQMQEALRKAQRRAAEEERARHDALTYEQRLREGVLKALREEKKPTKFLSAKPRLSKPLALKPHPWQVEARERLKQKDSKS